MILSILTSKAGRYLMAAVAALALLAGAYWWIVSNDRAKQKAKQQRDYIEGTQDDRTEQDRLPTDPDGIREWLRRFSE